MIRLSTRYRILQQIACGVRRTTQIITAIQRTTFLDDGAIKRAIQVLRQDGLIESAEAHKSDGMKVDYRLTEKGQWLWTELKKAVRE